METPNIQLYNFLRYDFHLTDIKSLEFMHILDKEYKSSVKEDLAAPSKQMSEGFQKIDARFTIVDERFKAVDERFTAVDKRSDGLDKKIDALDHKTDVRFSDLRGDLRAEISELRGDLRAEIKASKSEMVIWIFGIFLALAGMILATYFKK